MPYPRNGPTMQTYLLMLQTCLTTSLHISTLWHSLLPPSLHSTVRASLPRHTQRVYTSQSTGSFVTRTPCHCGKLSNQLHGVLVTK